MFGQLGMQEILIVLFILLMLFGAKRLPELGQSLGKGIREFKSGLNEIKEDIEEEGRQNSIGGGNKPNDSTRSPEKPRSEN